MKINVKLIFKVLAIVGVPVTAYFAAKGTERYQEGMEELKAKKPEENITIADRALVAAKSYGLAAGAGAVTVGSVVAMDRISFKELAAATTMIALNKDKIKNKVNELDAYKEAVVHKLGIDKAKEIDMMAEGIATEKTYIDDLVTDEALHMFHIDWLGFDLYFESTFPIVMGAIDDIKQSLFDCAGGDGNYTMDRFFSSIGRPDLITEELGHRGWDAGNLATLDCCYWLTTKFQEWPLGEDEDAEHCIDIWVSHKPNEIIME